MIHKYDGVKFYGANGWDMKNNLEKATKILESFDSNKAYNNVNEIIELYNIRKIVDSDIVSNSWDEEQIKQHKRTSGLFMQILEKYFSQINDNNFREIYSLVYIEYIDDFWELFVKFKSYNSVSGQTFTEFLHATDTSLYKLLHFKDLCKAYDKEFTDVLRVSNQTPELIIDKFLRHRDYRDSYDFPKGFSPAEYESILRNYISLETANFNHLQLLAHAQSSKECPISDKLRLASKRAADSYWEKHPFTGRTIGYRMIVKFSDIDEIKTIENLGKDLLQITYDIKWFLENLDYPTILNNFVYVFEYFDIFWRSTLTSVESKLGPLERIFSSRGIKEFPKGIDFNRKDGLSTRQMIAYHNILENNGIRLEDVFKWFFEKYLQEEFRAKGFRFNPPSNGTTLVEKCKILTTEMDGVLKQFRMYVEDGEIDRELFEISSKHIVLSQLSGFINKKYIYVNSDNIRRQQNLLFSTQTLLEYTEKVKNKYTCLCELLFRENVKLSDFNIYQQRSIQWLIECDVILENSDGYLKLNILKAYILKDLYDNGVFCHQYYGDETKKYIDELCASGDLKSSNSLFSMPEQNYLNYLLNKSIYSDGLDLRNKYAHGTYPENEETQFMDYIVLLKVMVLVIAKINEEFCLRDNLQTKDQKGNK